MMMRHVMTVLEGAARWSLRLCSGQERAVQKHEGQKHEGQKHEGQKHEGRGCPADSGTPGLKCRWHRHFSRPSLVGLRGTPGTLNRVFFRGAGVVGFVDSGSKTPMPSASNLSTAVRTFVDSWCPAGGGRAPLGDVEGPCLADRSPRSLTFVCARKGEFLRQGRGVRAEWQYGPKMQARLHQTTATPVGSGWQSRRSAGIGAISGAPLPAPRRGFGGFARFPRFPRFPHPLARMRQ
jgi:hypothetical protein